MAAVALDSILRTAALPQMPPRPVVLLHGFASTPRMLAFLAPQIRVRLECPVLRPALGFGWGDVLNVATCVDAAIAAAGFGAVDVVGHSLGGLVATVLLKHIDRGSRVRRVITLGTPHRGVPLARYAALATLGLSPCMRQLRPGSRFLARLAARPVPRGSELVAITGDGDAVVPERSSCIATAVRQRALRLRGIRTHADPLPSRRARADRQAARCRRRRSLSSPSAVAARSLRHSARGRPRPRAFGC